MKISRRIVPVLSTLMGLWVSLSFIGVMFNPGNAGLWTTSLAWSLIASVIVMPSLVIVHHRTIQRTRGGARRPMEPQPASPPEEETAFVGEGARQRSAGGFLRGGDPADQS